VSSSLPAVTPKKSLFLTFHSPTSPFKTPSRHSNPHLMSEPQRRSLPDAGADRLQQQPALSDHEGRAGRQRRRRIRERGAYDQDVGVGAAVTRGVAGIQQGCGLGDVFEGLGSGDWRLCVRGGWVGRILDRRSSWVWIGEGRIVGCIALST